MTVCQAKKFLDTKNTIYKNMTHKRKNNNLNFIKIKNSCFTKTPLKEFKNQTMDWKKIFTNRISDKDLYTE